MSNCEYMRTLERRLIEAAHVAFLASEEIDDYLLFYNPRKMTGKDLEAFKALPEWLREKIMHIADESSPAVNELARFSGLAEDLQEKLREAQL